MAPRIFHSEPLGPLLQAGAAFALMPSASRHVQVLRLQPHHPVILFDGQGGQYRGEVLQMERSKVLVQLLGFEPIEREAAVDVALAICCPANERMDWLVEKATELGAQAIYPLLSERVVLKLNGERAQKRCEHWRAIVISACEQSGRNRLMTIHPLQTFSTFLTRHTSKSKEECYLLSLARDAKPMSQRQSRNNNSPSLVLCGPEGGLTPHEEQRATKNGFIPIAITNRVLRSETASLAALVALSCAPLMLRGDIRVA